MDGNVEREMCNNCKKEIPQHNYVMHTMHCARNITLCKVCNEPIPKIEYEEHREICRKPVVVRKPSPPPTLLENSPYFQTRKSIEEQKAAARRENYLRKHEHLLDNGFTMRETISSGSGFKVNPSLSRVSSNSTSFTNSTISSSTSSSSVSSDQKTTNSTGAIKKPPLIPNLVDTSGPRPKGPQGLMPCQYCDLELPKLDLDEHEGYCGSRTDKCLECGQLIMFKNKQSHWDSNHSSTKSLNGNQSNIPAWDSTTQRSSALVEEPTISRRRVRLADVDYDPSPYLPAAYQPGGGLRKNKEGESYKEISRRLDCKTEYIRNLLHDSASITIPLRTSGTAPRNYFSLDKAPPTPIRKRRNPPTELTIPCEFCDTPIPHAELIEHETGCRPDLARFNPRRSRTNIPLDNEDDYTVPVYEAPRMRTPPRGDSPDVEELPCEFCSHMVPASQLWRHQLSCTSAA